jgi:hypothetical protein
VGTDSAVIGQYRGATRARVGACHYLRSRDVRAAENGPTPVHESYVRF